MKLHTKISKSSIIKKNLMANDGDANDHLLRHRSRFPLLIDPIDPNAQRVTLWV